MKPSIFSIRLNEVFENKFDYQETKNYSINIFYCDVENRIYVQDVTIKYYFIFPWSTSLIN